MSIVRVAKLAGTSHSTVSRVINNLPGVAPDTVEAVRDAMKRLNYVPPMKRRGPQTTRSRDGLNTRNIALLMFGADPTLVIAPVTAAVLHAAEKHLCEHGLNLVISHVGSHGRIPPMVESGQVDGLLMHGPTPTGELARRLSRFPTVWLMSRRDRRSGWGDRVGPDNPAIGRLAAEYLLELGHRHLALMYANPTHLGYQERAVTFKETAEEAGASAELLADATDVSTVPPDASSLEERVRALVDRYLDLSPRPTALFVPRDRVTVIVYRALRRRGIRPGQDVTIVSCDNDRVIEGLEPRPVSIDIRPEEMGRRAVEQLMWRLRNPHAPLKAEITIDPRLVHPIGEGLTEEPIRESEMGE